MIFTKKFEIQHSAKTWKVLLKLRWLIPLCFTILFVGCADQDTSQKSNDDEIRRLAIEQSTFIQIPGPNPILKPGPEGSWDDKILEASDALEEEGTYYFYYHATNSTAHKYRLGVATSKHPLGPFKKHGNAPILEIGEEGSWDDTHVACAFVMKEGDEKESKYYMWYSGYSGSTDDGYFSIGLATADNPLGPWTKHENNPIIKGFGYLGGVVKIDGKYRIYSAHKIHNGDMGAASPSQDYHSDYSPLGLAIGDNPEGPFKPVEKDLLLEKGQKGDWDEGGFSEAEVIHYDGMYHMFYGGTKLMGPRTESIGYAYSFNGFDWNKYGNNPVISRKTNPNVAAMAEVHTIIEKPFIYLYYTLRPETRDGRQYSWEEDLGVSVLITQRPFSLDIPVFRQNKLEPKEITALDEMSPIALDNVTRISLTAECNYGVGATKPITIHVRRSYNGLDYDTSDSEIFTLNLKSGELARKTFSVKCSGRFIKVLIQNNDRSTTVSDIKVNASVAG